ncbi:MAG TPA: hypothetical protein PK156_06555 [Polyangium sp.]|nr:hypothetical protein [Polyangium sp.]
MNSTYVLTMETNRPADVKWQNMPLWFHAATFVYFATNVFNGWALWYLKAPIGAIALGWFGLIGGFLEHVSPYFPKLYIHPTLEKILFRLPTVVAVLWLNVALGLAWYLLALTAVQSVIFMREKPLTSMEPRFHAQHVFGTHLFGAVQVCLIMAVTSRQWPMLDIFLAH